MTVPRATAAWNVNIQLFCRPQISHTTIYHITKACANKHEEQQMGIHFNSRKNINHQSQLVLLLQNYVFAVASSWQMFHLVRNVHKVVNPKADGHHRDEECKKELEHLINKFMSQRE